MIAEILKWLIPGAVLLAGLLGMMGAQYAPPQSGAAVTSSWHLYTSTSVPTFQGISTTNTVLRLVDPAGATTNTILTLDNTEDNANTGSIRLVNGGAGATPSLTAALQSRITGTGAGITTQNFGEDSTAATLTTINWQFNGMTKATLAPTLFTVPNAALSSFSSGGRQVVCMNNGVIYAGNNSGSGVPCP